MTAAVKHQGTPTIRRPLLPAADDDKAEVSNAGLELDRYQRAIGDANDAATALNKRIASKPTPPIYEAAYNRWKGALTAMDHVATAELTVVGRMAVGLGAECVRENAISLLRAYGVPVIPGSALKGLARHYAAAHGLAGVAGASPHPAHNGPTLTPEQQAENAAAAHAVLFGHTASAAYCDYFDAWCVPGSTPRSPSDPWKNPLRPDVITVHHPNYYATRGKPKPNAPTPPGPWDFDDPNPNPLLTAAGTYLIAVRGPSDDWARLAMRVLTQALGDWGVGAKTSSGYGRLTTTGRLP